jgi:glycosyltransferase involved in cell wall biosynthesis
MSFKTIKPIITIGLPAYNGEKTIKKTIDAVLSQTVTNFKLIISDDKSTDSTPQICREYEKKDNRVKYIQKNKNEGWIENFRSLAKKSNTKYFVWISNDDYWDKQFIEKNVNFLETNPKIVGSISDIKLIGANIKNYYTEEEKAYSETENSKFRLVRSVKGTYDEKIKNIIEFNWMINFYSIFRTKELQSSLIDDDFVSWDFAIALNIIKFGDLHVLDEILGYRDTEGVTSKKSFIQILKTQKLGGFKTYFPYVPFTIWCLKNLGLKNFIKNNAYFRYLNIHSAKKIIRELIMNI